MIANLNKFGPNWAIPLSLLLMLFPLGEFM